MLFKETFNFHYMDSMVEHNIKQSGKIGITSADLRKLIMAMVLV